MGGFETASKPYIWMIRYFLPPGVLHPAANRSMIEVARCLLFRPQVETVSRPFYRGFLELGSSINFGGRGGSSVNPLPG